MCMSTFETVQTLPYITWFEEPKAFRGEMRKGEYISRREPTDSYYYNPKRLSPVQCVGVYLGWGRITVKCTQNSKCRRTGLTVKPPRALLVLLWYTVSCLFLRLSRYRHFLSSGMGTITAVASYFIYRRSKQTSCAAAETIKCITSSVPEVFFFFSSGKHPPRCSWTQMKWETALVQIESLLC